MHCSVCKRPITKSYGKPFMVGNYCASCASELGYYDPKPPKPPTSGSNAQKPEHTIKHIHIDITKEYLEEYKAEIEREIPQRLYNEIYKIIQLLEYSIAINAESVTIQADEMPLLLNGLKKQLEENERLRNMFKPFNIKKK